MATSDTFRDFSLRTSLPSEIAADSRSELWRPSLGSKVDGTKVDKERANNRGAMLVRRDDDDEDEDDVDEQDRDGGGRAKGRGKAADIPTCHVRPALDGT
jgi:hypothetical protein